jgi:two-component system phosphate regulon sensor histidine kinase PhoR
MFNSVRQADWIRPVAAGTAAACLFVALCAASVDLLGLATALALASAAACVWIAVVAPAAMGPPIPASAAEAPPPAAPADFAMISALLEGLPDPSLLIDADGRIVAANAAARRQLQMQAPGVRLSSVLRRPELLDAVQDAAQSRRRSAVDYEPTGGVEEHFKVLVAPVSLGGDTAALMVFHDQTTMISTERMRVDFLANASHELRTPLASLTLLIETLAGHARNDPEAQERFLKLMEAQAERMARLIDDLLSLSKIELNEHVPPSERVDLVALARGVADTLGPIAKEDDVRLALKAAEPEAWVIGDRSQLIQVAQNLVDNAIKYSPKGGVVEIEISAHANRDEAAARAGRRWDEASRISLLSPPPAPERHYAVLRVVDSGPGIARRHLPRLSERFFRVEREETADHSGTGLGLAIVKHIVNRHRGGLMVESEVGRGSAFAIFIAEPDETAVEAPA